MWLGCLTNRIPKSVLFGWLSQPRPQGGPRRRWRDVIRRDLKDVKISEDEWCEKEGRLEGYVQTRVGGAGRDQAVAEPGRGQQLERYCVKCVG